MAIAQAVARPSEVVTAVVRGVTIPAATPSAGRLGTMPVLAGRVNDSTIALAVPPVVPGTYDLQVRVGGTLFGGRVTVGEPVVVAEPEAYVGAQLDNLTVVLDEAARRLAAPTVGRTAADSLRSVQVVAAQRAAIDSVRTAMAAASPADRAALATLLKVNEQALGLAGTSAAAQAIRAARAGQGAGAPGMASALGLALCYKDDGTALHTPEACSTELDAFMSRKLIALGGLLGVIAGFEALQRAPGVGLVVGIAGAAVAATQATLIYEQTMNKFVSPVLTAFGDPEWLFGDASAGVRALAPAGGFADPARALEAGAPVFVAGRARPLVIQAQYRSLVVGDANGGPGAPLAAKVGSIATVWDLIRALLPGDRPRVTLPATPATTIAAPVPPSYLQVSATTPGTLQATVSTLGDGWSLALDLPGMGRDWEVSVTVRYAPPGGAPVTATRTALLKPARYAVGSVLVGGAGTGNVSKGGFVQLAATVRDSAQNTLTDRRVTWASSDPARARVDSLGRVTAVDTGTVTITATAEGVAGSVPLRVTVPSVATIDVTPSPASVRIGQALKLVALLRDSVGNTITGRAITWTSASPAIARVDTAGKVTGVAVGQTTVTVASGGKSTVVSVRVSDVPVASVTIAPADAQVVKGGSITMTATLRDSAGNTLVGRELRWSSLSRNVATIDSVSGVVMAIDTGTTLVTATSEGQTATVPLRVVLPRDTTLFTLVRYDPLTGQYDRLPGAPDFRDGDTVRVRGQYENYYQRVSSTGELTGSAYYLFVPMSEHASPRTSDSYVAAADVRTDGPARVTLLFDRSARRAMIGKTLSWSYVPGGTSGTITFVDSVNVRVTNATRGVVENGTWSHFSSQSDVTPPVAGWGRARQCDGTRAWTQIVGTYGIAGINSFNNNGSYSGIVTVYADGTHALDSEWLPTGCLSSRTYTLN